MVLVAFFVVSSAGWCEDVDFFVGLSGGVGYECG